MQIIELNDNRECTVVYNSYLEMNDISLLTVLVIVIATSPCLQTLTQFSSKMFTTCIIYIHRLLTQLSYPIIRKNSMFNTLLLLH